MEITPKSSKRLLLCPQDRGGIGKSFIATLLYDYLSEHNVVLKTFDLDHANSTFSRFVPEAEFINTDVDPQRLESLNAIVMALEKTADVVLVDNRATGGGKLQSYIDDSGLIELQPDLNCAIVFVVVANEDKDALTQLVVAVNRYGDSVKWLVARNYHESAKLLTYDQSECRETLQKLGAVEVEVPCLSEMTRLKLQQFNLTVGKGRTAEQLHILCRSRCVRFHHRMREQFDKAAHLLIP